MTKNDGQKNGMRASRALAATFALLAVVSTAVALGLWQKVRAFDRKTGSDVLAGLSAADVAQRAKEAAAKTNAVAKAKAPPVASTNRTAVVKDVRFYNDNDGNFSEITIKFSNRPSVDDLRRAVQISPAVAGISYGVDGRWEWDWRNRRIFGVCLRSAAFKFRQPYVITVKKNLRFDDGFALEKDFTATVKRPDLRPSVSLAHAGRYLPAVGPRSLLVDSVNVSNAICAVWRVLPENVVQLLAREEEQYKKSFPRWDRYVDADSPATADLSTLPVTWTVPLANRPNERETFPLALEMEKGVVSNGVYLVAVGDGDRRRRITGDDYDDARSAYDEFRLVCLTDIGLSARQDEDGLRVWATSLASGRPLAGRVATLYAASREVLCTAKTDANGEATLGGWDSRHEPFALVVSAPDGSDAAFMAIRKSMKVGEALPNGNRPAYLAPDECRAMVWTERGIYRHGETIMVHAVLRNGEGNAPKPFPVVLRLLDAEGKEVQSVTAMPDEFGAVTCEAFSAPDGIPSGKWTIVAEVPGKKPVTLGAREVKIEEFVPPQIRVTLKGLPAGAVAASNLSFTVAAEHLFGGPAKMVTAESLVAFADAEFAPDGWKGFRFGDGRRGLTPNYTRLKRVFTDERGEATFSVAMKEEWGRPKAAVRMVVQGSAFETGGRPSVTRESRVVHAYPYYLGSDVPRYVRQRPGAEQDFAIVQVNPDGTAHREARTLAASLWQVETVYDLVEEDGVYRWDSQRVRREVPIAATVAVGADGRGVVKIPLSGSGDYELVIEDKERGLSHLCSYWVSADGDDELRASKKNPTEVSITSDQALYREEECPRLTLKCPFRGYAWLSVMRDKTLYTRVFEVTNLTQVVELGPLEGAWAPNVDVAVSLVQAAADAKGGLPCRAYGILPLRIRTRDSEFPVSVQTAVECLDEGGSELKVRLVAQGDDTVAARAVVTVVDEGINLLTNERTPDPVGFFSRERGGWHPLFDVYRRLLPVLDEAQLKASGVKTGGDDLAGMMNRVSPVPTRRFRPLSKWQFDVALTNGVGLVDFRLPEFVGEVRVTAFAYDRRGTGCGSTRQKVCPKLVMQPDAPRFAAPGDRFDVTLALSNRSGADGEVEYELSASGAVSLAGGAAKGRVAIADGDSKTLTFSAVAGAAVGQGVVVYRTKGLGEAHTETIELPVRPAVPWEETADVVVLRPGETKVVSADAGAGAASSRLALTASGSPVAELRAAYDFLSEYPHGCLEQTTSRVFPLLFGFGRNTNALDVVRAGVARVASMLRETDFTMWPDCDCPPWDREVSLYAAHFLVEAAATPGVKVDAKTTDKVCALLKRWALGADTNVAVYACHTLVLAGRPEKDRMNALYDGRDRLSLLSRARLARAFVRVGEPLRARELVAGGATDPKDVREAAFALMTLLELDPGDARAAKLVLYLQNRRDRRRCHWGTTGENAHALLALGAYYRAAGIREGEAKVVVKDEKGESPLPVGDVRRFEGGGEVAVRNDGAADAYLSVRRLALPDAASVSNRHHVVTVSRRFKTSEGFDVDLNDLRRGDLLVGEIVVSADRDYDFSDLVIQELLPACLEPERREVAWDYARWRRIDTSWVLRSDTRDDRVVAFSRPIRVRPGADSGAEFAFGRAEYVFCYAVRVVTAGEFVLPGTSVEAMYAPEISARLAPSAIRIRP